MQYLIKLSSKIKISKNKGETILLNNIPCKLLINTGSTKQLFLESSQDLSPLINAIASLEDVEVLMLDDEGYHKTFKIKKETQLPLYQINDRLLSPSGKSSPDMTIKQLDYYLYLCNTIK